MNLNLINFGFKKSKELLNLINIKTDNTTTNKTNKTIMRLKISNA